MKLKKLPFLILIVCTNVFAQLDLDNLNLINDNYLINDSTLSDINNDGFKDMVSTGIICDRTGVKHSIIAWQENDHFGNFGIRNILYTSLDQYNFLEIESKDIDNDGDNDIVFEYNNNINVIKNINNGVFSNIQNFGASTGEILELDLVDMNNDNYPDIIYRTLYDVVKIKWNLANGQFGNSDSTIGVADIGFQIIELNNHGAPDIVFDNNTYLSFSINLGNKTFYSTPDFYINHDFQFDFGDFNNDNFNDLVIGVNGTLNIYYSQWSGVFYPIFDTNDKLEIFSGTSSPFYGLEIADLNNDNLLDVVFDSVSDKLILQNINNTDFSNQYPFDGVVGELKTIDLNNDGLLDIINNEYGKYNHLFINKDNFGFQFNNYSNNALTSTHTVADINDDNLSDIVSFKYKYLSKSEYDIQYLINKGQGNFERKTIPLSGNFNYSLSLRTNVKPLVFDVDNDNLKDIVVIGNDNTSTDKILWIKNLGNEVFDSTFNISETGFTIVNPNNTKMFFGDFDNDGDNDLFLSYKFIENINGVFQNPVSLDTDGSHSPILIFNSDNNTIINIIAKKTITEGVTKYMSLKLFKYDSQRNLISSKQIKKYNMLNLNGSTCDIINNMTFLDFDNNGFKDIIYSISCSSVFADHDFIILKGHSNDYFSSPQVLIPSSRFITDGRYSDFDIVDIDKDNDVDIIETTYKQYTNYDTSFSRIHFNDNKTFDRRETLFSYVVDNRCEDLDIKISITDLDNDGILDLLKCNAYEYLTADLTAYDSTLGVEDNIYKNTFVTFPNPTNEFINIKSNSSIAKMFIYNELGQLILKNENKNKINLSSLKQGIYFLKIEDKNGVFTIKKVIKE